jgi:hypothetical protein
MDAVCIVLGDGQNVQWVRQVEEERGGKQAAWPFLVCAMSKLSCCSAVMRRASAARRTTTGRAKEGRGAVDQRMLGGRGREAYAGALQVKRGEAGPSSAKERELRVVS